MGIDYKKFSKIIAILDMCLSVAVFMIWVFQPSSDIKLGKYAILVGIDIDIFYANNHADADIHDIRNTTRKYLITLSSMFALLEGICSWFLLWGLIKKVAAYTDPWMSFKFTSFLLQIFCLIYYFVINESWSSSIVIPTSFSIAYSYIALQIVVKAVYQLDKYRTESDEKYSFFETVCRSFSDRAQRTKEGPNSAQQAQEGPNSAQQAEEGPNSAQQAEEGPNSAQQA